MTYLRRGAGEVADSAEANKRFELINITLRKPLGLDLVEAPPAAARAVMVERVKGTAMQWQDVLVNLVRLLAMLVGAAQLQPEAVLRAEGGNAAKSGAVREGDLINMCSATLLKAGKGGQYEREVGIVLITFLP